MTEATDHTKPGEPTASANIEPVAIGHVDLALPDLGPDEREPENPADRRTIYLFGRLYHFVEERGWHGRWRLSIRKGLSRQDARAALAEQGGEMAEAIRGSEEVVDLRSKAAQIRAVVNGTDR